MVLGLPGSAYLYAGDELGLPQATVPDEAKQDPIFFRSGGARTGRDGCRIPMPWNSSPGVGFSPDGAAVPWLPTPADWGRYAVSVQAGQGGSTLPLHRRALALRKAHPAFAWGSATVTTRGDVLTIRSVGSGEAVRCGVNMGSETMLGGCPGQVLLASPAAVRRSGGTVALPPDSAVWVLED